MMHSESSEPLPPIMIAHNDIWGSYAVANLLSVNPTTVVRWSQKFDLPCYKTPSGHRRYNMTELAAFLRRNNMPVPYTLVNDR